MALDFLVRVFEENRDQDAIIWHDHVYTYEWLLNRFFHWMEVIRSQDLQPGAITIMEADFSPNSIALFLALVAHGCILVPLTSVVDSQKPEFIEIAQGEVYFKIADDDTVSITMLPHTAHHELYQKLCEFNHPGLILFSSGSTGKSKAAVHDLVGILDKFRIRRHKFRTIFFLLYDHIGGVNTMLYTLANAGCGIIMPDRSPDNVLRTIEKHRIELLPTTPTFMNLVLLSEAYQRYNLDSLKLITYGTEPMPESTLKRFHEILPQVQLLQTYGLSEVGILSSKSRSSDSLWVKIGGEGFATRVVDGILHIKARSAMLGYLNAPSPFTADGWFDTGDCVEVDGEYIRILGRESEIINVGGEKVYPIEVESIIQKLDNVSEVTVYGESNSILGNIVCARVSLVNDEDPKKFALKLKQYCRERLQSYKVPIKILVAQEKQHSDRFKKRRVINPGNPVSKPALKEP
jgi:acyl-coenzyme A synthetase/AMP-(fatty) acid ligase